MDNQNPSHVGYWVAGVIAVILIIGGVVLWRSNGTSTDDATNASTTDSTTVLPYGQVTLGFGQSASFRGITITPLTLAEDSRCATGVQCVWAGTVRVAIRSDLDSGASLQNTITLGSTTPVGTFAISLVSVTPNKQAASTIANSDYRFTFDVHQNGNGAGLGTDLEGKG